MRHQNKRTMVMIGRSCDHTIGCTSKDYDGLELYMESERDLIKKYEIDIELFNYCPDCGEKLIDEGSESKDSS